MWQPERRRPHPLIRGWLSISLASISPRLPSPIRASLFNYYSPRGLRHFQGVLTITDGAGGSHTRRLREAVAHRHAAATLFSNPPPSRGIATTIIFPTLSFSSRCLHSSATATARFARARNLIPLLFPLLRATAIYNHAYGTRRELLYKNIP